MRSTARLLILFAALPMLQACRRPEPGTYAPGAGDTPGSAAAAPAAYLDSSGRDDELAGGAKMIPVATPKGMFRVWTKRVGNNPRIKVLLLHGGPGATHEYFEAADSYFPAASVER